MDRERESYTLLDDDYLDIEVFPPVGNCDGVAWIPHLSHPELLPLSEHLHLRDFAPYLISPPHRIASSAERLFHHRTHRRYEVLFPNLSTHLPRPHHPRAIHSDKLTFPIGTRLKSSPNRQPHPRPDEQRRCPGISRGTCDCGVVGAQLWWAPELGLGFG